MTKRRIQTTTIDERLGQRLIRATRRSTEFTKESKRVQAILESGSRDIAEALSGMEKLIRLANEAQLEVSAAIFKLKENGEIGDEIFEKLAQDATLVQNLSVFMKSDPAFVSKVLTEALPETLKAAFMLLNATDRQKLREVLE